jgi:hypothetical protein
MDQTQPGIRGRIADYCKLVATINDRHWASYENMGRESVFAEYGRRFCKVMVGSRVHTFVELATGNILKAASWKAPAKNGVRGSIWADDLGESVIDWHGAKYLR